jgi:hypothetical protein
VLQNLLVMFDTHNSTDDTYPVVIVKRYTQFAKIGHLAAADKSENVSIEHPAAPTT